MEEDNKKKVKRRLRGFSETECRIWKTNILIVVLLFVVLCSVRVVQTEGIQVEGDEEVTDIDFTSFELISLDQKEHYTEKQLKEYDLTVINFWETTCIFCIQEMPDLNELSKEYQDQVQFLGVCADAVQDGEVSEDHIKTAKTILQVRGQVYPQTMPSKTFDKSTSQLVGFPKTFFIDRDGKILMVLTGKREKLAMKSVIDQLLKEARS